RRRSPPTPGRLAPPPGKTRPWAASAGEARADRPASRRCSEGGRASWRFSARRGRAFGDAADLLGRVERRGWVRRRSAPRRLERALLAGLGFDAHARIAAALAFGLVLMRCDLERAGDLLAAVRRG